SQSQLGDNLEEYSRTVATSGHSGAIEAALVVVGQSGCGIGAVGGGEGMEYGFRPNATLQSQFKNLSVEVVLALGGAVEIAGVIHHIHGDGVTAAAGEGVDG